MATLDDAYNQLVTSNSHLTDIHNDVQAVNSSVEAGFSQLATLIGTTNSLLQFETDQNRTIICNLEKISRQTCELVNQATRQAAASEAMREELSDLKQIFELVNPAAAVEQHRLEELEAKVEKCCPPEVPVPPCTYEPCPAPQEPPAPSQPPPPPRSRASN